MSLGQGPADSMSTRARIRILNIGSINILFEYAMYSGFLATAVGVYADVGRPLLQALTPENEKKG